MLSAHAMREIRTDLGRGALTATFLALTGLGLSALIAQDPEIPIDYDAAIAQTGIDGSYGYFRTIDGSATLIQTGTNERIEVQPNEPILVGDRVFISGGSRAELVLADRNIVRVSANAELGFRALANSGDTQDVSSVLDLKRGTLQLVVLQDQLGQSYPSVITPNASVRTLSSGSFLIVVDGDRRTEVVAREGQTEVITEAEAAEVRAGESLFIEGARGQNLEFAAAPSVDALERWGANLSNYAQGEYSEYVDPDLQYGASTLEGHGSWVDYGGGRAWRPRVAVDWAPYRNGRWRYTPSGLFWVSYEPWGWTPYHYGYWDRHDSYGWLWYPGRRFASAHVYWYWGADYSGWIPTGYYWRHYGNQYGSRFGFHYGVYGSIGGGGFGAYRHWTFLPHGRLGSRRQHFYSVNGQDLGRRRGTLGRGVLFTDSRSLRPDTWRRPNDALAGLRRAGTRDGRALADAQPFVERGRLTGSLERIALTSRDGRSAGGAVRAGRNTSAAQPNPTTRRVDGRAAGLDRETLTRGAGARDARERPNVQSNPANGRTGSATVRRPTTRSRDAQTGVRSPTRRPTVDEGGTVRRPSARPQARSTEGRTLRRPDRPVTREGASARPQARPNTPGQATRPTARPQTGQATRPTARPQTGQATRPTARPQTGQATRPTARPQARETTRPTVRRSPSTRPPTVRQAPTSSRPTVRRSGGTASRPTARPQPSARTSRPTVNRSRPSTSRPTARPSNPTSSRPTVRRSGGNTSRPAARPQSSSRSSRPAVRSSRPSSSRPAARSSQPRASSSRPAVRSSQPRSTGSRPAARSSGGSSSRPAVSRSSGGSRSAPRASSGSSSRGRSGSARSGRSGRSGG